MQPQSQMPPSMPPQGPPHGPPPQAGGWTDELILQVSQETGIPPEQIKADIERTGAATPAELYPNIYQNEGIQPEAAPAETVAPGAVQGQPPPSPGPEGAMPLTDAPMAAAPAEPEGISPEVAQAMHDEMSPMARRKRMRK